MLEIYPWTKSFRVLKDIGCSLQGCEKPWRILSRGVIRGDVNFRWDTSSYGEQTTVEGAGS